MKHVLLSVFASLLMAAGYAQTPDTLSIDSIQWRSQTDLANCVEESRYNGDTVVVYGICTVDGIEYGSTSHNIHITQSSKPSPFGGLRMRVGDPNANYSRSIRNLKQGDSIQVTGVLSEYRGETQLSPMETNGSIVVLNRNVAIKDTVISGLDISDNNGVNNLEKGERWEGNFVTIKDVTVATVSPFSGNRVSFTVREDATGALIQIGDHFTAQRLPTYTHPVTNLPGKFVAPNPGDKYASISGIIVHSRNCPGDGGRGYQIMPFDASHYVFGPSAPAITNEKRDIAHPKSTDEVTVSADITDKDGTIVNADLYYNTGTDVNNLSFTKVAMTKGSGKNYSAKIPKQADGTFVRYYISAEDDSANVSIRPNKNLSEKTFAYRVRDNGIGIYDVQYTPFADRNSIYDNIEVTVTGVVTASGKDGDLSLIHIQDETAIGGWSGVLLLNAGQTFERGQKLEVTGTVTEQSNGSTTFRTAITVSNVVDKGTGNVKVSYVVPDTIGNGSIATKERYESVLVGIINGSSVGNGKLHVVDTNPDAPNNYAEYLVGRDPLDPATAVRVVAGRPTHSSTFVSYVNASTFIADSASYPVQKIIVADTMNLDTLYGIVTETYGNFKLLPRNNDDYVGINVLPEDENKEPESVQGYDSEANFNVYPNPVNGVLTVQNLGSFESINIHIYDVNGREVYSLQTQNDVNRLQLQHLDAGTYVIRINDNEGALLGRNKFIKQ